MSKIILSTLRIRFHSFLVWFLATSLIALSGVGTINSQNNSDENDVLYVGLQNNYSISNEANLVSLQITNMPLEEAFQELADQLRVGISYNPEVMPDKKVTLEMRHAPVYEVIYALLENTNLESVLPPSRDVIVIREKSLMEEVELYQDTVSGIVFDAETGEPLPGVNILVQGTTDLGTTTNIDGEFELTVPSLDVTLVFSYIGYQQMVVDVAGRSQVSVELLTDVQMLDDLVVTAFGLERERRALGYSTQNLSGEVLTEARETNIASSLAGRIAGVQISSSPSPGGSTGIIIRGASSLTGDNQPLVVVDGIPIDNQNIDPASVTGGIDYGDGIGNLNPDEIEDLSVLKGPNAAALYGSRAANGAIVITTKSGRGLDMPGIGLTFNSNLSIERLGTIPRFQNKWSGGYSTDINTWNTRTVDGVEYFEFANGWVDQWGPSYDDAEMVVIQDMPELGPVPFTPQAENNIEKFYQTGITATNSITYAGGVERASYIFSFSDLQNEGMVPGSSYKRNNVSLRVSTEITDNLNIEGRASYIRHSGENRTVLSSSFENPFQSLTTWPSFIDIDWMRDHKREDGSMRSWRNNYPINPYWLTNELNNEDSRDRIIGFISAQYNFTDWLNLKIRSGTDTYSDERFRSIAPGTPGGNRLDGVVVNNTYKVQENNTDALLTGNFDISEDLTSTISLGGNYSFRKTEITGMEGRNLNIDGLYHISNANLILPRNELYRQEIQSVFGLVQFGYKDIVYLDLTGRNDWSSTLGRDNYSFFYPSVGLSFVFSDVLNVNPQLLTFGRIRASYAETGADADPYLTMQGFNLLSSTFNGRRMSSIQGTIALSDLKNEHTSSYEFGLDLRLLDNRVNLDFTYYDGSTTNQIFPVVVSAASGFNQRVINAGEIRNSGIELTINSSIIQTSNFRWSSTFNFSRNNSEVISLAPGVDSIDLLTAGGGVGFVTNAGRIEARPGKPFGNIVGYPYARNDEGQIIVSSTGSPTRTNEREVLGNIQPDWLGGFINTFHYRGFSLSGVIDIRQGGEVFSFTRYEQMAKGTGVFTENRENLIFDGVIENEDGTFRQNDIALDDEPHMYYAMNAWGAIGEPFVVDASYISMREITLGYSLSPALLENLPFIGLKLSVTGRNLFYFQRADEFEEMGIAPESAFNRDAAAQGFESRTMPLTRTIGFNLNLEF